MSCDRTPHIGPCGVTFVELLIAISVSTLVLAVAVSVYITLSAGLRRQDPSRLTEAAATLDMLRHDLATCLPVAFSNVPAMELDAATPGAAEEAPATLTFCNGNPAPPEGEFNRIDVRRVRYALQAGAEASTPTALQREELMLWGAQALGAPVSNRLMSAVSRFDVAVLDGDTWTNHWVSQPARPLPRAARIRLDWVTARTTETATIVVFIPAGNPVKPAPLSP